VNCAAKKPFGGFCILRDLKFPLVHFAVVNNSGDKKLPTRPAQNASKSRPRGLYGTALAEKAA